jgi:hypothetical protein
VPAPTRQPTRTAPRPQPKPEPQEEAAEDQFAEEAEDPFAARDSQSDGASDVDLDMTLDMSDTPEEIERPLLPPGVYDAEVRDVQFGNSRRSGNPMLTWIFAAFDKEQTEHTLFYHTVLNDERGRSAAKKTIVRLLNDDEDFDWKAFKPAEVSEWAVGRTCQVVVRIQNSPEFGKSNSVRDVQKAREGFLQ